MSKRKRIDFGAEAKQEPGVRARRRDRTIVLSEKDRDRFLAALDRGVRAAPAAVEKAGRLHRELADVGRVRKASPPHRRHPVGS